jgi:serine/threonine protein phosphatase 1
VNRIARFWTKDERRKSASRAPEGVRIYAIGDIHGRRDLLDDMLAAISDEIDRRSFARNLVVFLGDLIDRGPDSAGVIERLANLKDDRFRTVFIAGNHEEVLLRILEGEASIVPDWLRFGGLQCAESYGLDGATLQKAGDVEAARLIKAAISESHQIFLRSFADSFTAGDYLFVHAGIRPGLPIEQQTVTDLRWIRSPFLESQECHPQVVVHGHSISREVELLPYRIGVDTGAYRSGSLSAVVLEGAERRVIHVAKPV